MKISILFLISLAIFSIFPWIDLEVSSLFYDGDKFFLKHYWFFQFFYKGLYVVVSLTVVILFALWIYQLISKKDLKYLNKKAILYLFLALIIGPGLVTNTILKDNWDRARPNHVVEFGGTKSFTPFYKPTNQCDRNCSFVSGHSAAAFFFLAFAFIFKSRKIFYVALLFGVLVSITRVVQGGHFFSDVVFAFFINYFFFVALYRIMYKKKVSLE